MFSLLYKFFDFLGKKNNLLLLSPSYRSFGDKTEQIYFGLLHCQNYNKKLILIKPFSRFFFKKISISNSSIYKLEHELIKKPSFLIDFILSLIVTLIGSYYFIYIKSINLYKKIFNLRDSEKSRINLSYAATPKFGRSLLYEYFDGGKFNESELRELETSFKSPTMPKKLIIKAEEFLKKNTPNALNKRWIVMHILDNTKTNYARGANIKNYKLGLKYLISEGFHIFRIGDANMPSINLDGLSDLTSINHEDYIDLYLLENAYLYIGNQSGPAFTPHLFRRNSLITNGTDWSTAIPRKKDNFFILKNFYNKKNNKRIPLKEIFKKEFNFQVNSDDISKRDIYLKENSAEDLLNSFKDYLNFIKGEKIFSSDQLSKSEIRKEWINNFLVSKEDLKINYSATNYEEYLRKRSIVLSSAEGKLAPSFVEKYWN
tara:strand:+ start:15092 stop:16381 length:1290 start_codon:yes stop_codon:yes gene_type:complete